MTDYVISQTEALESLKELDADFPIEYDLATTQHEKSGVILSAVRAMYAKALPAESALFKGPDESEKSYQNLHTIQHLGIVHFPSATVSPASGLSLNREIEKIMEEHTVSLFKALGMEYDKDFLNSPEKVKGFFHASIVALIADLEKYNSGDSIEGKMNQSAIDLDVATRSLPYYSHVTVFDPMMFRDLHQLNVAFLKKIEHLLNYFYKQHQPLYRLAYSLYSNQGWDDTQFLAISLEASKFQLTIKRLCHEFEESGRNTGNDRIRTDLRSSAREMDYPHVGSYVTNKPQHKLVTIQRLYGETMTEILTLLHDPDGDIKQGVNNKNVAQLNAGFKVIKEKVEKAFGVRVNVDFNKNG